MKQKTTIEYNSLSCFLQLENLDTETKQTKPRDPIFRDVNVLKLYYDILRKVEKDPFKYWDIYALRNYLWYFYKLSKYISDSMSGYSTDSTSDHEPKPLNVYAKSELAIFFTGLYSKYKKNGSKEGLFIVCERKDGNTIDRRVMTYSEFQESNINCLNDLIIKSTFEECFCYSNEGIPEAIKKIEGFSNDEYNNYNQNENGNYEDTRLHILIDGVDNIPDEYFRILYGICPGKYVNLNGKKR